MHENQAPLLAGADANVMQPEGGAASLETGLREQVGPWAKHG